MIISNYMAGEILVFSIEEPLGLQGKLDPVLELIGKSIAKGEKKIALQFTADSFLYSSAIRILVQCIEIVREASGVFGLVEPNADILDAIYMLSLDTQIRILRRTA